MATRNGARKRGTKKRRAATGKTTSAQIAAILKKKDPELRAVAQALRTFVRRQVPGVTESINPWGIPTFDYHGPLAYFMVRAEHITFGFHRGAALRDPRRLLEGTGKSLCHVKLRTVEDLDRPGLRELLKTAARLNRKEPAEGMMARKS